jgi:hypothetical protein
VNGYIYQTKIAADIPVAILEILENVDYYRTPPPDVAMAEQVVCEMAANMIQKTQNYRVADRSTNINSKVLNALTMVNWGAYPPNELQEMCAALDLQTRNFLSVLT